MKKVKALLLSLLSLSVLGMAVGCSELDAWFTPQSTDGESSVEGSLDAPIDSSPDSSADSSTDSSPDSSSDSSSTPSPFDGIEFSDAATVIPAAYALETGATLDGTYTLKGQIISSDGYNESYNDISVTMVVEGYEEYPIYCYQIKQNADKIGLGDYIAVQGTIKNYKGKVEFDKPTLLAYEDGQLAPSIDVTPHPGEGIAEGYQVITVEQALAIAKVQEGGATAERYYIHATVETVTNPQYGEMIISDETGSISVFGTYSADGEIGYVNMTEKPVKGDEVLLSCTLNNYNGSPEVKNARLITFKRGELDVNAYLGMSIAEAREATEGTKVRVEGVVAQITYANGLVPNGIYLVDDTNSIYVFDTDLAGMVSVGNTITVLAEKTWWILETEQANADKFGYKGCNQLANAWLLENDGEVSSPNYSWVTETTVKTIMDTPVSTDITTSVYKVTALVKKSVGTGFINYYIDDLDGVTGSYVYTQCDGKDLTWLEEFDGKICTVYLSVINAKSTATGCNWRFKVLKVMDENYTFDPNKAPQFALDYYAVEQFETTYTADPALEMITSVSSELLGFENVELSYASSNTNVIYFETADGKTVMHCGTAYGTARVTITATLNGIEATAVVDVEYTKAQELAYITVAQAIAAADETMVVVKGIVGPSLVNQVGFYLFGEEGDLIAVKMLSKELMEAISVGNEVILQGKRERQMKDETATSYFGQTCIEDAEILVNNKGNHAYSTAKFVTGETVGDVVGQSILEDYTTTVYVLTGTLTFPTGYGQASITDANGGKISFYSGSISQYNFLQAYTGQEVTLEVALCNWNGKTYWTGCVLAIRLADGTKVVNELNFQ